MANPPPRYKKPRVFVRSVDSITYSLNDARRQRLTEIPRVIRRDYREFLNANLERVEEKTGGVSQLTQLRLNRVSNRSRRSVQAENQKLPDRTC
jgi:hypothetical protein